MTSSLISMVCPLFLHVSLQPFHDAGDVEQLVFGFFGFLPLQYLVSGQPFTDDDMQEVFA